MGFAISFIIPAHNEEANIGRCLESVLKEIKNNFYEAEIIVVNNASTDKTKEIALSFPRVKVVDENKKGIVFARQAGFLASKGDLIANIDADNIMPGGWLKKVFTEFAGNPNLAALSGPCVFYDLPRWTKIQTKIFYGLGYLIYIFNEIFFKKGAMLQGGNFIVRRTALEKIGGFDTSISFYGEDTDIARRIRAVGPVKFTFSLPILSSGRRLAKEGAFITGYRYALNFFWILVFKRPFTKEYKDIRE
ncbi:MAG: glycosyl transferase family 2 [Candidatus Magasanikbacteria bacterium RIFCSPLOWO2_01_FULL_43_20b]|uniref:Glycosyl transferase family 2 n=1 Tax=Candidatus Magasanikbacteria bacterium RIFCSPLOWO2_12_FULL_43_12 TaxID=1798692 RepID=A0A1F6MVU1_9BACT|nr:MAG: glycosyl transferase family 2 [Candidatus Magasanikbacteria bacterium RIFCSPLOWO2_02_FULL_43_22]OGH72814.1 MAG: glycosyl transferase family 2 [Candidatus Magasanikbacteria bacterium RIFCSPLOWO2_01_FULL_43_20b]OGH75610.1 MAG: glycosyl transferase family 2 [Candidatus Magasanikbacteria bacterium RIFCSPLOWO2_12_FULL_43_12]